MVETNQTVPTRDDNEVVVDKARDFWARSGKTITIAALAVIVLGAAYLGYKYLVQAPKEKKAADALAVAEGYFRADSLGVALNGDGVNPGMLKVIDQYGGTKAGNLARYYAGTLLLKQGKPSGQSRLLESGHILAFLLASPRPDSDPTLQSVSNLNYRGCRR